MERSITEEIFKKLPHKDCGKCGLKTCAEFAKALLKMKKNPTDCPHLNDEQMQSITLILDEYFDL
ncbi:MAG: (Fe-S)-binding protein [Candidatus Altiarchaeota archaeon]|nr:(Fe-S)-binding protein [Candidatus Altiarchaeota archaeon]